MRGVLITTGESPAVEWRDKKRFPSLAFDQHKYESFIFTFMFLHLYSGVSFEKKEQLGLVVLFISKKFEKRKESFSKLLSHVDQKTLLKVSDVMPKRVYIKEYF